MEEATRDVKVIIHEENVVQLTLTLPEARTLRQLLTMVGGDRETSLRKHTDNMGDALTGADIPWLSDSDELCQPNLNSIYYKDNTLEVME